MDTWGMLPKSQEDSETIEQAIERIVAEHNDDPTAHLGTGQSLQVHRESEAIDHLAGSVLADKMPARQLWFDYTLFSLDGWEGSASGYLPIAPGIEVSISPGTATNFYYYAIMYDAVDWFNWAKNPYFEFLASLNAGSSKYREVTWGGALGDNVLGFRTDNNTLYAVCVINGTDHTETITGASTSGVRNYRAYVDPATGNINFEIDGVLVKQMTGKTLVGADTGGPTLLTKRTTSGVQSWAIYNIVIARDM